MQTEVDTLVARLRAEQLAGPAGVRYNSEGRSWGWGNAVVGRRNAIAPPLDIVHDAESESAYAEFTLGAAYEGPPGMVHGGVSALLLDQIMGGTLPHAGTDIVEVLSHLVAREYHDLRLDP